MTESSSEKSPEELPREEISPELHEKSLGEIDLGNLAEGVEKYNNQFSWGKTLGRMFLASVESVENDAGKSPEENIEKQREKSYKNLLREYKSDLARTGLGLEPVKSGAVSFSGTGKLQELKVRVNLSDGKRFLDYLSSLDKNNLTSGQIKGLEAVAKSLAKQLVEQYNLGDPDDKRMIELMGNLPGIVEKYSDFKNENFNQSANELSEYLEISKGKYLKEYLSAKKEKLLSGVGSNEFGPSDWHGDSSPESYEKMWTNAIEKLVDIGRNKNAKKLYEQIISNLKQCLEHAKKSIKPMFKEKMKRKERSKEEYEKEMREYLAIVDEFYDKLEKLEKENVQ